MNLNLSGKSVFVVMAIVLVAASCIYGFVLAPEWRDVRSVLKSVNKEVKRANELIETNPAASMKIVEPALSTMLDALSEERGIILSSGFVLGIATTALCFIVALVIMQGRKAYLEILAAIKTAQPGPQQK